MRQQKINQLPLVRAIKRVAVSAAWISGIVALLWQPAVSALTPERRIQYTYQGISFIDDPCSGSLASTSTQVTVSQSVIDNVKLIIGVAKYMGVGQRGALIALMAGITESSLLIDDNPAVPVSKEYPNVQGHPAGDHNSVGIFQMQPDLGWSTFATGSGALTDRNAVFQDMDPASASEIFFGVPAGTKLPALANPGALTSPGHRLQT